MATDVAGRGIDIQDVSMVVNYDMAKNIEGKKPFSVWFILSKFFFHKHIVMLLLLLFPPQTTSIVSVVRVVRVRAVWQ